MPRRKKKKSHAGLIAAIIIIVLLAGGAGAGWFFYSSSLKPASNSGDEIAIEVEEGATKDQVLSQLEEAGLIRSKATADLYSKFHSGFSWYAGIYELSPTMSVPEIFDYLSDPANIQATYAVVTIPEGTWAKDIARTISKAIPDLEEKQLLDLWNDAGYISELAKTYAFIDADAINNDQYFVKLEGYLYPETYYIDFDMTPDQVTRMLLDQFGVFYNEHKAEFDQSGMSVHEVVTFASVIQFESGAAAEMPEIAGVFKNRMDQGMPLQSSVTVCYALYDEFDSPQDCETNTEIDSPYNTYKNSGLPVGPILNPGAQALLAALHPADNEYLYFVGDIYGDGTTHFAKTYEEHLENVQKYGLAIE